MYIRLSEDRGYSNIQDGGIESYHTFSFASYWDKNHAGISVLKAINDDTIKPSCGFETHSNSNIEILTYVTSGTLKYTDSLGNEKLVNAGHVQLMRAGAGISHSDFNAGDTDLQLIQIWIEPQTNGLEPCYQSMAVAPHEGLKMIASFDARAIGHMHIEQDVKVFIGHEARDAEVVYKIPAGRKLFLHMIKGEIRLDESMWHQNPVYLYAGDGLGLTDKHAKLHIHALKGVEFLLFDLPSASAER